MDQRGTEVHDGAGRHLDGDRLEPVRQGGIDLQAAETTNVGAAGPQAVAVRARHDLERAVAAVGVVQEEHRGCDAAGIAGERPVRQVLVEGVHAAVARSLEVELLGEEHRGISPREVDHRIDEPRVERQHGDRLREVGEGLESVDDIGVAFPLHDDPGEVILLERVAALAAAGAATPGDQPFEEGFALRCDRRHLGVVEESLSDHVPVSLQREELGLVQPVLPHAIDALP